MEWNACARRHAARPVVSQSSTAGQSALPSSGAEHSRFVQRVRRRWGQQMPLLAEGVPSALSMTACLHALQSQGFAVAAALRVLRQLVIERLCVLDVEVGAPLHEITETMSTLAEVTLDVALQTARAECEGLWGVPRSAEGQRCQDQ